MGTGVPITQTQSQQATNPSRAIHANTIREKCHKCELSSVGSASLHEEQEPELTSENICIYYCSVRQKPGHDRRLGASQPVEHGQVSRARGILIDGKLLTSGQCIIL